MNLSLQIGTDIILAYRRLAYTHWHALAEFVDNSTQSYINNKAELDEAYAEEKDILEVSIVYDRDQDLIRISDTAMGMSLPELENALRVGIPPANTSGRSQYGLGLKV